MNKADRTRLATIIDQAHALLNAGDTGSGILNLDVLEAMIADVQTALAGRNPSELASLITRDEAHKEEMKVCDKECGESFHFRGCAFLVKNFKERTADGTPITDGLAVWDYNLEAGTVSFAQLSSDGWFEVCKPGRSRGTMMNAERVCVRHPFNFKSASDALKGI